MNRRTFIRHSLTAGALALGAGTWLNACGAGAGQDLRRLKEGGDVSGLDSTGYRILHYASLAPSGHNTQPWTVRLDGPDQWTIGADPKRRLPAVDPDNREVLLSIGAFVENMVLAGAVSGIHFEPEIIGTDPGQTDLVRVRLQRGGVSQYPMKRMETRRTVKHGLQNRELRPEDAAALSEPHRGKLFYFPAGTKHADCIREAAVENFRIQAARDDAQAEMVRWLRLSRRDIAAHRDGLTPAGMEIRGIAGFYVQHMVDPEDFLKPMYRSQGVDLTARLASEGAGWMIVTSEGSTVADIIDAGRRFQKTALLARERGIGIHPMTQTLEEGAGRRQVAAAHDGAMIPQFILRVGYVDSYPDPVSPRRPVEWFVRHQRGTEAS